MAATIDPATNMEQRRRMPTDDRPDAKIVAEGGRRFPVHSAVLGSASPVLENALFDHRGEKEIPILGVPPGAVDAFIRCLYSSRWDEEGMRQFDVHLLVLSHVLRVPWLKSKLETALASSLAVENVVDMLQLARLCDAPRLYVRCMGLLRKEYGRIEKTEGWEFVQEHDPWLELEVLQFLQEAHKSDRRRMRKKREQRVYMELSEAMDSLHHICTEGCTCVGPRDRARETRSQCEWGHTCEGVQRLIQHFATCGGKKKKKGCGRCARMWQLLHLHSSICDRNGDCKVPLCKQFKERTSKIGEEEKWKVLARKVVYAKTMSSLCKKRVDSKSSTSNGGLR